MKSIYKTFFVLLFIFLAISCSTGKYSSNGESIYKAGKTLDGKRLLDKKHSQITLFKSCQSCHGPSGDRISRSDIRWSNLSNPEKMKVPYTDELLFRFLDEDLKSDGSTVQTGVHWQMTQQEKNDLLEYLKSL